MSSGEIPMESPSASLLAPQSEQKSAIPGMFCMPWLQWQKHSKGATVEEKLTDKTKKTDYFLHLVNLGLKRWEWRTLYHKDLDFRGTETDSYNEDETKNVFTAQKAQVSMVYRKGYQFFSKCGKNRTTNKKPCDSRV